MTQRFTGILRILHLPRTMRVDGTTGPPAAKCADRLLALVVDRCHDIPQDALSFKPGDMLEITLRQYGESDVPPPDPGSAPMDGRVAVGGE